MASRGAGEAHDFCVKPVVEGLRPGRWYYYPFPRCRPVPARPVGRTRTLPEGRSGMFRIAPLLLLEPALRLVQRLRPCRGAARHRPRRPCRRLSLRISGRPLSGRGRRRCRGASILPAGRDGAARRLPDALRRLSRRCRPAAAAPAVPGRCDVGRSRKRQRQLGRRRAEPPAATRRGAWSERKRAGDAGLSRMDAGLRRCLGRLRHWRSRHALPAGNTADGAQPAAQSMPPLSRGQGDRAAALAAFRDGAWRDRGADRARRRAGSLARGRCAVRPRRRRPLAGAGAADHHGLAGHAAEAVSWLRPEDSRLAARLLPQSDRGRAGGPAVRPRQLGRLSGGATAPASLGARRGRQSRSCSSATATMPGASISTWRSRPPASSSPGRA